MFISFKSGLLLSRQLFLSLVGLHFVVFTCIGIAWYVLAVYHHPSVLQDVSELSSSFFLDNLFHFLECVLKF